MLRALFTKKILIFLFFLFASYGCNFNPLGGSNSHVDDGNSPFLSTPKIFEITDVLASDSQVSLLWGQAQKAKSYTVWYGTSSKNYTNSVTSCNAQIVCNIPSLQNGIQYYFKVTAQNAYGNTDSKTEIAATVGPFQSVNAISGDKTVYLIWNAVDIAKTYSVNYGIFPGPFTDTITNLQSTYTIIPNLNNGTTYQFQVTATNNAGSVISNISTATPLAPPFAPTAVTAVAASSNLTNVSWNAAVGLGTIVYQVSRSIVSGGPYDLIASNLNSATLTYADNSVLPGMQYYYVVSASNSAGSSPNSLQASVVTPTTPPTNLYSPLVTTSSAVLQWLQSPGNVPISYTLKRSSASGGPYSNVVGCINISVVNCTDSSVSAGTQYFYVASATNSVGTTANSAELALTTQPNSPTGLVFSAITANSLQLSWTPSSGTAGQITYSVFKSTTSGSNYLPVPNCIGINGTSCSDNGLSPGTNYYYVVLATTSGGSSPNSSESTTATLTTPPSDIIATVNSSSSISLNWQTSPGSVPITYQVKRATNSGGPYTAIASGTCSNSSLTVTTCTDLSASPGLRYYYVVLATTAGGTTSNSIEANAVTATNAPTGLSATAVGNSSVNLSWTASPGSSSLITYQVYRSETSGFGYILVPSASCEVISVGVTSCVDTAVDLGKKYYYVVTATTDGGISSFSAEANATTTTTPPVDLIATTLSSTSININWSASPGTVPITYIVLRSTSSSSGYVAIASGGCSGSLSVTSCIDSSVTLGTTYYYIITATTAGGTSGNSGFASATTPTNAPATLTAASAGTNSINLSWTASPGSAQISYTLFRSTTSGSGYSQIVNGTCGTNILSPIVTCVDNDVLPGTKYFYVVTASTTGGVSVYSSEANATTITNPPANVTASPLGTSAVNVTWSASSGNATITYTVLRSLTGGGINYVAISSGTCQSGLVNTFTCTDTSASPGNSYYYVVKATTAGGVSTNSAEVNVVLPTSAPTNLTATSQDTSSINLTWTTSPGTTSILYNLYRSTSGTGPFSIVSSCNNVTINSCSDTNLIAGTTYYYVVTSITAGGESVYSTQAQATTFTTPPVLNNVNSTSSSSVSLSWTTSPGTASISYDVARATTSGGPYTTILSGGCSGSLILTSCTDTTVVAGTSYYYVLTATTAGGVSAYSNEVVATTIANAPTSLIATANGGGVVNLTWTASSGTAGSISYIIKRSLSSGGPYSVIDTNISSTSYSDFNVSNGTTYYYVVQAMTSGGNSGNSNQITVTPISSLNIIGNITAPNQVTLTWNTALGATNYTVKQSTTMGGSSSGSIITNCSAIASTTCVINSGLTNGTTYYYTVFANNVGVGSTASNSSSEATSTPFNTPFTTITAGTGQVVINWNAIPNANNYNIYVSQISGNAISGGVLATGCSSITLNSCTATGLTNGTKYYFAMVANLSTGGSFNSGEIFATPIGAFDFTAVTGLSASSAQISWGSAVGASSYNIIYGIVSGTYTFSSGPYTTSPATISNLNAGTTYYFKIVANNGQGNVNSNSEFSTTLISTPPTNVTATAASSSTINLSWNISPGNSSINYIVQTSSTSGGPYTTISCPVTLSGSTASCTDTSVSAGNKYFYIVKASNTGGTSSNSSEANAVTPTTIPTGLAGNAASSSAVFIFWNPSLGTDPISYTLKRANLSGGPYTNVVGCTNITSASCTDTSIISGSNYFYVVSASNAAGNTGNSTELSLTSQASAPTNLISTAANANAVNLSWSSNSGGASLSFIILRSTQSGGPYTALTTGGCAGNINYPTLNCQDTTAQTATKYYYVAQSVTSGGTSGNSNETSVTTFANIPINVTAAALNTTSISLNWTGTTGSNAVTYLAKHSLNGSTYTAILAGSCQTAVSSTNCFDQNVLPGTTYYYIVNSITAAGSSANSTAVTATTPTLSPTNLVANVMSGSVINFSWTASPGTANITYSLMRSGVSGGPYTLVTSCSSISSLTCSDTTVSPGTQYFYVLLATTAGGNSPYSTEVTATTAANTPTNLVATATGSTSVTLSWTASVGSTNNVTYTVKRSTVSGSGYTSIISGTCSALVASTTCTDQNLSPGTVYYYVVIANTAGGSSANSVEASVTMPTMAPTNLIGSASSSSAINLSWTASPSSGSSVSYTVKRSVISGSSYSLVTAGTCSNSALSVTNCTDTSVNPGFVYYYIVNATNLAGTTNNSNQVTVTVPTTAPTNVVAVTASSSTINLSWNLSPGNSVISYVVGRSTTSGSGYVNVASGGCSGNLSTSTSSCSDSGLSAGVTYFYTITAINGGGSSPLSSEVSATTITNAPSTLTATATSSTNVNLAWGASTGSANVTYQVSRSVTSGSNYSPLTSGSCNNVTVLTCIDSTALPGYKYYYIVTAINSGGTSIASNEVTVNMPTSPPTGFSFTTITSTNIVMTWAPSPGLLPNTYTVLRSSTTGGPYTNVVGCVAISSLNCTDSSVAAGTAYFYIVRATNSNGTTGNSIEINTVTPTTAPTGLSATAGGSFVNFTWTASTGTAALITYSLSRSQTSGASYSVVQSGINSTSASDNSVFLGTTYYYVVNANTSGGVSANSNQVTVTPIGSFSITTISSSSGQITLNWNSASGAANYTVKSSTTLGGSSSGTNVTGCVSIVTLTCTATGLTNGTTYYFTVFANNTGVNSSATNSTSEVSSTPLGNTLTISGIASSQISLNWASVVNATTYNIYFSTSSGNAISGGQIASGCSNLVGTSCTATGLSNGVTYYFALVANLSVGGTFQSSEISGMSIAPFDFTSLSPVNSTSANINWSSASGAQNYTLQYGAVSGTYTGSQGPVTTTSIALNNLSPGNSYFMRIKGQNSSGNILSTSEKQLTLPTNPPSGLSLASLTTTSANLYWVVSPGNSAINYNIFRSNVSGSGYVSLSGSSGTCGAIVTTNICTDSSIASGSTYYYVISATNSAGTTAFSNEITVTSPPNPPTSLTANPINTTQIQMNWSTVTGNSSGTTYTLSRSSTSGGAYSPVTGCKNISAVTCIDSTVAPGTTYFYVLTATNPGGTSVNSSEISATSFTSPPNTFTAMAASSSQVNLSWSVSPGTTNITYTIFRSLVTGGPYTTLTSGACTGNITVLTCQDTSVTPGIKYFYIIKANTAAGASINSFEINVTTPTTAPTSITATAASSVLVNIGWVASPGSSVIYNIKRSTTTGGPYISPTSGTCSSALSSPVVSCNDASVLPGVTYYYVLTASTGGSTSANSIEVSVTLPTTAPTTLVATTASTTSIALNWTASPGSASVTYNVLRSINGTTFTAIPSGSGCFGNLSGITCTDSGLTIGTQYYYVVTATNSAGTTSNSVQTTATTLTTTPTGLSATATSSSSVTLSWTVSPGSAATTYNVFRSLNSGSGFSQIVCNVTVTASTANCLDSTATAGNIYFYNISATNAGGTTTTSSNVTVTLPTNTPTTISATATNTTTINISWSASPGNSAISYIVLRSSTNLAGSFSTFATGTCTPAGISSLTCSDTGGSPGNIYYYAVQAINSAGTTVQSSSVSTVTQTTPPTGVTATISGAGSISVNWTASPGNATITYTVKRSTASGSGYVTLTSGTCANSNLTNTFCSDLTNPVNGTVYYYVVTATNAFNTTANSNIATVTYSSPVNTVVPVLSGAGFSSNSNIITSTGNVLSTTLGTWSDSSNCTYSWYANNNLISGATSSTYTTQTADLCKVLTSCVTCSNFLGSSKVCINGNSTTNGINTNGIITDYTNRVSSISGYSLTAAGQGQIKNFLDNLITNNISIPDVLYAMQKQQNAGYGSISNRTVFDLYCDQHNSTLSTAAFAWDQNGVLGSSALAPAPNYGIAISNSSIFNSTQPSTIVAYAQNPSSTNFNGIFGYSNNSSASSTNGFGFNNGSGNNFRDDLANQTITNSNVGYNFVGRSLSGSSNILDTNGTQTLPSTNASALGGGNFILGNFPRNGTQQNFTLNGYLAFAAAWTNAALNFSNMEIVRSAYTVNFPVPATVTYIGDNNGSVYTCTLSGGAVPNAASCAASTGYGSLYSVSASSSFLYVVNSSGFVYACPITNNTIPATASGCLKSTGFSDSFPAYPTIYYANNYVYVVMYSAGTIYSCPVQGNGSIPNSSGCSVGTGFNKAYAGFVKNNYFYLANYSSVNKVTSCPLSGGVVPNFSGCSQSSTFTGAWGMGYNGSYAYVGGYSNGNVYVCPFTSGVFPASSTCTNTANGFGTIWAITSTPNSSDVYIVNSVGVVYSCPIAANGSIPSAASCSSSSGFGKGYGISIY
ncbi:fibronectin type III domain-containing protein [Pigmentibacter sp. JX0631]|uniref:fibronectin type III domain-containing protein n=1 Tax=Pigmentibacter sp. JX0631 TaxID=2976982 RepID=UPI0024688DA4|nr:fibronectin type III domain-containing protein [Pigmentibacter sp. JX0631]WGL59911.1 fibronectin type III domain-containing protein [Pigmentibacter sp. JX0631]